MAQAQQFFWPPDNSRARAASICLFASGLLVPDWSKTNAWYFTIASSGFSQSQISGVSGVGFAGCDIDGSNGAWLCQYNGSLYDLPASGAPILYTLPSTGIFTGVAYAPSQGQAYVISSSGIIYTTSGTGITQVGTMGSTPTWFLTASGSTLFTLIQAVSAIGTFSLTSTGAGVSGSLSAPMSGMICINASTTSSAIALGGYNWVVLGSGFNGLAADPVVSGNFLGITTASNTIAVWTAANDLWSFATSITGQGAPANCAWAPDGVTIFVTDTASGKLSWLNYSGGTLAVSATFSVTGAGPVGFASGSSNALVCQKSQNLVTPFVVSGANWVAQTPLAVTGASSLLMTAAAAAAVGFASGVAYLSLVGNAWSISSSASLSFTPVGLSDDNLGNIYAVGTTGTSGILAVIQGTNVTQTMTWAGSGTNVLWVQGQICVADSSGPSIRVFGLDASGASGPVTGTNYVQFNSLPAVTGISQMLMDNDILLAAGTSNTWEMNFTAPFVIERARQGVFSLYSGGTFHTQVLPGIGDWPTAVVVDPNANAWAVTRQNNLYIMNVASGIVASGALSVFAGQAPGTPLEMAALTPSQGFMWCATSGPGTLFTVPGSVSGVNLGFLGALVFNIPRDSVFIPEILG